MASGKHGSVVDGDVELVPEVIAAAVPPNEGIGVRVRDPAVVGVPDAPGLDEARVEEQIDIGCPAPQQLDDLLLDD